MVLEVTRYFHFQDLARDFYAFLMVQLSPIVLFLLFAKMTLVKQWAESDKMCGQMQKDTQFRRERGGAKLQTVVHVYEQLG